MSDRRNILKHKSFIFDAGFTLVELVVALGIFSILVVSVVGIMIQVGEAQVKASNIQAIQDNIRFSVELMTREMRTGGDYQLTNFCTAFGSGSEITFTNFNTSPPELRMYYLVDSDSDGGPDMLMRLAKNSIDCNDALPFTSEEVIIEQFRVTLHGEAPGSADGQPWASIVLYARSRSAKLKLESTMNLQTTVEQRFRDIL
jgi:prepilin-type N-terminal cleavage/methylation domain-containing protein